MKGKKVLKSVWKKCLLRRTGSDYTLIIEYVEYKVYLSYSREGCLKGIWVYESDAHQKHLNCKSRFLVSFSYEQKLKIIRGIEMYSES